MAEDEGIAAAARRGCRLKWVASGETGCRKRNKSGVGELAGVVGARVCQATCYVHGGNQNRS